MINSTKSYNLAKWKQNEDYDFLTSLATQICEVKTAIIILYDKGQHHFVSTFGLQEQEKLNVSTFWAEVINVPKTPLIVEDFSKDKRFSNKPLIIDSKPIVFYAGIPLVDNAGSIIGTFCIMDIQARQLDELQLNQLKGLAKQTAALLKMHKMQLENQQSNKLLEVLQLVQKNNKIGYWELDIATGKTVWSELVYDIHEVPYDFDHNTVNGIEFYHPDYRPVIAEAVQNCIETGEPFDVHCLLITGKGNKTWVRSIGNRKGDKLIGSFQDITELKKEELKFKGIFNSTFSFTGFLDTQGILLEANDTAIQVAGLQRKDLIGKYFWDCYWWQISKEAQNKLKTDFNKVLKGESVTYEVDVWSANEIPITILFSMKPVFDELGKVEFVIPEGRPIVDLVETRNSLTNVLEGSKLGTWEWNIQNDELIIDKRWADMVGYTLDELAPISTKTWEKLTHPGDLKLAFEELQKCFNKTSDYYEVEIRMKHKAGHWIWVTVRGKVLQWTADDQPLKMFGTHEEITEWKKQNEALRISEEAFRGNFEAAGLGMALLDENGKWLKVNQRLCEIVGYAEDELKELTFQDITHPDDLNADLTLLGELVRRERTHYKMEKRYFHKNGQIVYIILAVSVVRDENGGVLYFISQIIDITQQKLAEQKLKKLLAENKAVMDATTQVILITTDTSGKIIRINTGAEHILGFKKHQLKGRTIQERLLDRDEWNKITSAVAPNDVHKNAYKQLAALPSSEASEVMFKTVNNKSLPVLLSVSDIKSSKEIKGYLFAATDISHIKAIQAQLERQNEQLEQFAYVAAHDMKEPLRAITTYLSLFQKKYGEQLDEKANTYVQNAFDGAKKMKQLILDILDYSKSGQIGNEEVDLDELVETIFKKYNQDDKQVNLSKSKLPTLIGDHAAFIQLFTNLIDNGTKYQTPGNTPDISIQAEESDDFWTFNVADNGIGIDPAHQSRVFEVFKRLHIDSEYSGTGIGLATCKNIISILGGKIWFEPNQPKGTIFKFTIPKK